jgi:hypothetical protein
MKTAVTAFETPLATFSVSVRPVPVRPTATVIASVAPAEPGSASTFRPAPVTRWPGSVRPVALPIIAAFSTREVAITPVRALPAAAEAPAALSGTVGPVRPLSPLEGATGSVYGSTPGPSPVVTVTAPADPVPIPERPRATTILIRPVASIVPPVRPIVPLAAVVGRATPTLVVTIRACGTVAPAPLRVSAPVTAVGGSPRTTRPIAEGLSTIAIAPWTPAILTPPLATVGPP